MTSQTLSPRFFATRSLRTGLLAVLVGAGLTACSSVKLDDVPVETRNPTAVVPGGGAGSGSSSGAGASRVTPVDLSAGNELKGAGRVIYFDYDSFVVKDEYRATVDTYAKVLNADKKKRVMVEGHTDDRGGSEYNLALGQKRAEAVAKALALLGAGQAQVEAVSYGKERPAVQGSDEAAYAKNRRAELNLK